MATAGHRPGMLSRMDSEAALNMSKTKLANQFITQLHAAAVNGDKNTLGKFIISHPREIDIGDQFRRTPLMYCVLADRLECAEILIKAGCFIDKTDKGGRTALHWAAHKGNHRLMKLLLSKGSEWKEKDLEGQTALQLCTRHKASKCLALLLKYVMPGEVDDQDNMKRTALHWSASYGNLDHMRMLLKQDSNIGIPDTEGKTPLHWAASCHDHQAVNCVKLLLEVAPSVINWQDYEGRTALHLAVAEGSEAIVDVLTLTPKCNVSALDNMFRTPLHWAAVLGHTSVVAMLLARGADYASSDSNGATALHYAAQNNYAETAEIFLKSDKIVDEPDVDGRTAFMWACSKGADKVLTVWMKYTEKVDIKNVDKNGASALHAAALSGHASTVKLLLDNGAQIDSTDLLKHTPLFRACEMGHTDVVQTLMDHSARVDLVDNDGRSPLHWAALGGHAYICQMLIKYGVDPNFRDLSGRVPLHCASYGGCVNCMSVLIENKADPNTQDNEGMSALHWACSKGHLDAVKLLLEYNAFSNRMEFTEDRYTPLDYALMGEHHAVAQFLIEQGSLSISGIQEIAAAKVQSYFRGYRVRKTFLERKQLLMKHEQLRKDAAKKKADDEYKRRQNIKNLQEIENRRIEEIIAAEALLDEQPATTRRRRKRNEIILTEEERILRKQQNRKKVVDAERSRQDEFRLKQKAASTIQRGFRHYLYIKKGVLKTAQDAIRNKRLEAGEEEWIRQIAALTIQLAWRKYCRKRLLKTITPNRKHVVHTWDPESVSLKQKTIVKEIYSEKIKPGGWTPTNNRPTRPTWSKYVPSPAALSYNFAVDQYHPVVARQGHSKSQIVPSSSDRNSNTSSSSSNGDIVGSSDESNKAGIRKPSVSRSSSKNSKKHWSYNMMK
ncbi:uncharacterized protein LOC141901380 [Tubulanus polymorphus]|uniref:uncharacterized protein LOC141901380 n=1 Tax=Tubulanus polymorphus TaxID=672921 RepID=UPI003DA5B387